MFGLGAATRIYLAVGSTDMCKGQDRTWWADDKTIWRYAADNGLLIVSRDSDFHGWSTLYGFPPKVIWQDWELFDGEDRKPSTVQRSFHRGAHRQRKGILRLCCTSKIR